MITQPAFLQSTGLTFLDFAMYGASALIRYHTLIFSPVAFPARTLATPASEPELRESDRDCGLSSIDSFANYDPDTCSWKTLQRSFIEELTVYSGTWPRAGMTRNGSAYQQPPLARHTSETGSSLWRTPTVEDAQNRYFARNNRGEPKLSAQVKHGKAARWPTPQARDYFPAHRPEYIAEKRAQGHGMSNLNDAIGGQLNPQWVEWLMGFPIGWTDLED